MPNNTFRGEHRLYPAPLNRVPFIQIRAVSLRSLRVSGRAKNVTDTPLCRSQRGADVDAILAYQWINHSL